MKNTTDIIKRQILEFESEALQKFFKENILESFEEIEKYLEQRINIIEKRVEEMPQVKTVVNDSIKKSVRYRLRWGDTLWDISETFYKNPWKYKKIARYNGIKNPNRIIAGRYITIPAK